MPVSSDPRRDIVSAGGGGGGGGVVGGGAGGGVGVCRKEIVKIIHTANVQR